jgi:hypothetical protein
MSLALQNAKINKSISLHYNNINAVGPITDATIMKY